MQVGRILIQGSSRMPSSRKVAHHAAWLPVFFETGIGSLRWTVLDPRHADIIAAGFYDLFLRDRALFPDIMQFPFSRITEFPF